MLYSIILQASGIQSLRLVSGNIADYVPYVQGLCFVLAALCAVFFVYLMYEDMIHDRGRLQQKMLMCIGSVLTFIGLAVYTPAFFGLDKSVSGSFASDAKYGITGVTEGGLQIRQLSDGSISTGTLVTNIPELDSPVWLKKYDLSTWTPVRGGVDLSEEIFLMYADLYSKYKGDYEQIKTAAYSLYSKEKINRDQYNSIRYYSSKNHYLRQE